MKKTELRAAVDQVSELFELDPIVLRVFARIESNWNPKARNDQTGASGLFQFLKMTAGEHNIDPMDPIESACATAMRVRRDKVILEARDIEPTVAHLYLCHQQGRAGFLQLYRSAYGEDGSPLPAARGRTMAANLPAREKTAWTKLPNDEERARYFIDFWRSKIAKFATEEA